MSKRFENHKKDYNKYIKNPIKYKRNVCSIFDYYSKYGIDNFDITLIKKYEVCRDHIKDRKHLCAYETLWICKTKNCVNKNLPFNPLSRLDKKISSKKYSENNPEKEKARCKKYRENNKEKKKESDRKYRENNKEKVTCNNCGSVISKLYLSVHKKTFKCSLYKNLVPIYI